MSSRRVPLDKRQRTETSCDKCKTRKQKCRRLSGQDTCSYCRDHGIKCVTTQARKTRIYGSVEGLGTRIALLEGLVKGLLPEADLSGESEMRTLGQKLGIALPSPTPEPTVPMKKDDKPDEEFAARPDQQGQFQYIGRNSSFLFHVKLRTLIQGTSAFAQSDFVLFGRNPADESPLNTDEIGIKAFSRADSIASQDSSSMPNVETFVLDSLVASFFEHVHPDFPVLHEASFREDYEAWSNSAFAGDSAWTCCLLCVFLLASRCSDVDVPRQQEDQWWSHVQTLLPSVLFTSSISAVQAILLTALHLHNFNHRDACWTLTGSAIRVAYAIGLHRDTIKASQTPMTRELRKQIWWSLYAFEQMQVSSHDRPSAIEEGVFSVGSPQASMSGMSAHNPPEYCSWSIRLATLLGRACRTPRNVGSSGANDATLGPLSPTARLLRDMDRWHAKLPLHLRLEGLEDQPHSFKRPLLMLHANYHYITTLVCRSALLYRATTLLQDSTKAVPAAVVSMSETCHNSGRLLCQIMLKLDRAGKFNAATWWDIYYTFSSSLILVLDIVCSVTGQKHESSAEARKMLQTLAAMTSKHLKNRKTPGTMRKWGERVLELIPVMDDFIRRLQTKRELPTQLQIPQAVTHTAPESLLSACGFDMLSTFGASPYPVTDEVSPGDTSYLNYMQYCPPIPISYANEQPMQAHPLPFELENPNLWQGLRWDNTMLLPSSHGRA